VRREEKVCGGVWRMEGFLFGFGVGVWLLRLCWHELARGLQIAIRNGLVDK